MTQIDRNLKEIQRVKKMLNPCIQCGTCSASCPNIEFMDITPRHMWRLLLTNQLDTLFASKSFNCCSSCYYCTLRCPRGLELTLAIGILKQVATKLKLKQFRRSSFFYKAFLDSVRKHGRVNETEFMTHYFFAMKNPLIPIRYAPLGLKLMRKGKLKVLDPHIHQNQLGALFKKVVELEN